MFLLRSAFWLTLAFLVIRPEMDMREQAAAMSAGAMAQGSQFIAAQIEQIECTDLTCIGGKAIAAAALKPSVQASDDMQTPQATKPVPYPLPRPEWAG